jgi:Acyclic terpene utilisation family protein AtuA
MKDPGAGFDPLLAARMRALLSICVKNSVKIVTNMGAANPAAAADATREIARSLGLNGLNIATVTGDDVLGYLLEHDVALDNGKTIAALGNSVISANAYIGVASMVEALKAGADVSVQAVPKRGRRDPSLRAAHSHEPVRRTPVSIRRCRSRLGTPA